MGAKVGRFASIDGREYVVRFEGSMVVDAELELGVPPVVISMAQGEHKFCGFKSTTATVTIVTDDVLTDLYASGPRDVSLRVTDAADGAVVFDGWVVPFAFDQPCSGHGDTVTVNAVDLITALKDSRYDNVGDAHGVDVEAIKIVEAIAYRAGLTRIVTHVNFNYTEDQGTDPLSVMVAQAGFLQDENDDCEVLSAICKFFGYTAHVVGDTLYMYDEHAMLHAEGVHSTLCNYREYDSTRGRWIDHGRYTDADNPMRVQYVGEVVGDATVSIERAYDGIQITPEGREVSVLLPDVCARDNAVDNGDSRGKQERMYQNVTETSDYAQYRTPRQSRVMDLGVDVGGVPTDKWSTYADDAVVNNSWSGGAMLLDIQHLTRKRWRDYGRQEDIVGLSLAEDGNMVWMRGLFGGASVVGKQKQTTCYSHTGGHVKLSLSCKLMRDGNWIDITQPNEQGVEGAEVGILKFLRLSCGAVRYDIDSINSNKVWVGDLTGISNFYTDGATTALLPTIANRRGETVIRVPNDGQIRVDLAWNGAPALIYSTQYGDGWNIYISQLSLEGYGDAVNTACDGLRHAFHNIKGAEYLDVNVRLTTRNSDTVDGFGTGINARPGVVTGWVWNGSYMGRADRDENIPIAGILMEQLKARYGTARVAYSLTAEGNIRPFAAVEYDGGRYTVEAYDWDLADNVTTVVVD